MTDERIDVIDNETEHRFELLLDGRPVGLIDYIDRGGVRVMPHTEIDVSLRGRGLSLPLIRRSLDATRAAGLKVDPACPAVAGFIAKHPDYADLVA